jgi:hypothetical protein
VVAVTIRLSSAQQRFWMQVVIGDGNFVVTSPVTASANQSGEQGKVFHRSARRQPSGQLVPTPAAVPTPSTNQKDKQDDDQKR